jgi:hypothetical protein
VAGGSGVAGAVAVTMSSAFRVGGAHHRVGVTRRATTGDGIDTFVFRDGLIQVQTVRYTLQHRG